MFHRISADVVVLIHFFWILFLLFGGFWGVKHKIVRIFHLSGLILAFILQLTDWCCPLTYLEVWLRSKHSPFLSYTGSFIVHTIEKIVYIEVSRYIILVLTIVLCGLNVWIYFKKNGQFLGMTLSHVPTQLFSNNIIDFKQLIAFIHRAC